MKTLVTLRLYSPAIFVGLLAASVVQAQDAEPPIVNQLRSLISASSGERPAATLKAVAELRSVPVSLFKVQCADMLAEISMRDDPGIQALKAVAAALMEAVTEFPVTGNGDEPAEPYLDLARLVRYEHAGIGMEDPRFLRAMSSLAEADAKAEKADFTLKDLNGQSYTLSKLHGKVVLVNFWASWCGPCLVEMPFLDKLYARLKDKGLMVLAISNEEETTVRAAVSKMPFHAPVLLDPHAQVGHRFGLEGLPRTFVFDRQGKLAAVGIEERSERQFAEMLSKAGMRP